MDGDADADVHDLIAFLQAFSERTARADLDDNGTVDVFDLIGYLQAFSERCSEGS